jgi:hypothetical protein
MLPCRPAGACTGRSWREFLLPAVRHRNRHDRPAAGSQPALRPVLPWPGTPTCGCCASSGRGTSDWLFPGRNAGQPAEYRSIAAQLREHGLPLRTARVSTLRQLVLQLLPPSSAPSASTTPPPCDYPGVPSSSAARSRPRCGRLGNVLRCDTILRSMVARLSITGTGGPLTRPASRLSSLRNSAWMAAEGCWTSGAVPVSSPCDWPACSRAPSALTPIRR